MFDNPEPDFALILIPVPPTKLTASNPVAVNDGCSPVVPLAPIYQYLKVLFIEMTAEFAGKLVPFPDKSNPLSISKYKFRIFV